MRTYLKPLSLVIIVTTFFIFACVTINIYFPAEQVESVAEEIVDEIRGKKSDSKNDSSLHKQYAPIREALIAFMASPAWAQDVTSVSNATIRALKNKMKARFSQMKPYYQKGMLKEGGNGFVSVASTEGLGLKDKRDLNNLVSAENQDRKTLYQEVAKALKIDAGQVGRIAEIFATEWQKSVQ